MPAIGLGIMVATCGFRASWRRRRITSRHAAADGAPASPTRGSRPTAGLLAICAVGLACWIVYLGFALDQHYVARRWGLAWMGLDIAEAAGLLGTALLLHRRSAFAAVAICVVA